MKHDCKIRGGLAQSCEERKEKLDVLVHFLINQCIGLSLRPLRLCAKKALVFGFGSMLAVFLGCATSAKVTPPPVTTVTNQGPSVTRLSDGRQGFVIQENVSMDNESRENFERAVTMMNDGKNDKAIELLTQVVDKTPGVTAPYIDLAVACMRTGKLELAEQHLKIALLLVPNHPVACNEYGLLLRKAGRFKEAREIYEKALESFPDYLPVHRNLGILCDLYLNDPECALKQFEIYSEGMTADAQVKIWIAELRMRLGRK